MQTSAALILIVLGSVLLALDRLLGKEAVSRLDTRLEAASERFRPLDRKKHFLFLLFGLTCVSFWGALRFESPPPSELQHWLVVLAVFSVVYWILGGLVLALRERRGAPIWLFLVFALATPFLLIWFFILSACRLALYPFLFPLKGVVLLNRRWFQSVSGIIGLAALVIGTVLQCL